MRFDIIYADFYPQSYCSIMCVWGVTGSWYGHEYGWTTTPPVVPH